VRHLRDVLLLPGVMAVVIPALILGSSGRAWPGGSLDWPFNLVLSIAGGALIGLGLSLMVQTIRLFASIGQGTLAPWDPTRRLVVRGPYRRVRNPMITGVFAVLLGEALLFGSLPLLYWFAGFVIVNLVYIPLLEEPSLARRFGEDYRLYRANVPRWLPRVRPWVPPWDQA
jgi:protein-S-isoprenylcysteine O-methyltransferase Ste14